MKNTIPHSKWRKEFLSKPENVVAYLNAELEEGDMFYLLKAIRNVVAANGGMGKLAKAVKMSRTTLYKTLSKTGNPGFATLEAILAVYGVRMGVFAINRPAARPSARGQHHGANYHRP